MTTTTSQFEEEFKELHRASLALSTHMVAALGEDRQDDLYVAINKGGILILEMGPLPSCQQVVLIVKGADGSRRVVTSISESHEMH
jgi:hypothetical protein